MRDLKERTIRAGFVKAWSQAAVFSLRIVTLMVLARLLEPRDFGLVAMVTVITGVFKLFQDAGLSLVTVQRPSISKEQVSTLFWINILVGASLWLLSLAASPILVTFYEDPRLFWVTIASAAGFLLNAAGVQHAALLQRQMRFTALATIETLSCFVGGVVGIGMALTGFGYWSLVGLALAPTFTSTMCVWLVGAWIPGPPRKRQGVRSMLGFGGKVTLNGLVIYACSNLEKVLLGRFWGAEALGIYGRASQLINIPRENLNSAVALVALSALARLQNEPDRFKNYFLKGYSLVLALTLPVTIATALFADEIIFVVLGPAWKDAAHILRLLAPTVLVYALINPLRWLLYSIGMVGRSLMISIVLSPLVIIAYIIGLPHGPKGVALAYSVAMLIGVGPHIAWSIHKTSISMRNIVETARIPAFSAMAAGAVAMGLDAAFGRSFPAVGRLAIGGGILGGVYLFILLKVMNQKAFYIDLLRRMLRPLPSTDTDVPTSGWTV